MLTANETPLAGQSRYLNNFIYALYWY